MAISSNFNVSEAPDIEMLS